MKHQIQHLSEPERLYLAWQAPSGLGDRFRWAVAVLEPGATGCVLRYLQDSDEFRRLNSGRHFQDLKLFGFAGYPGFDLRIPEHEKGVLDALMRRLPPRDRADFREYLRWFCLPPGSQLSDFALLGYTGAKLPSDGFSIVDPLNPKHESCEVLLEVAGFQYHWAGLKVGDEVSLRTEPENPKDAGAVAIYCGDERIGYVNRLKAPTFLKWLETRKVTGVIERVNGNQSRPRAFVFVWVRPSESRVAA